MGSYNMDSHHVQRYVDKNGHARNEGDIQRNPGGPYPIDYGAIIPKKAECENLLVPVAVSSSHIAYGSIRMEPVFMILGQSAATAACLSLDNQVAVQDLSFDSLRSRLLADGQILSWDQPTKALARLDQFSGIVVDDTKATLTGTWSPSNIAAGVHRGYQHDGDKRDGKSTATFTADLEPHEYEILIAYTPNQNRATNVPITIKTGRKISRFILNQRQSPKVGTFHPIARLHLAGPTSVIISNTDTDGYVIIDAVRFVERK
jgi:hypothetical protein